MCRQGGRLEVFHMRQRCCKNFLHQFLTKYSLRFGLKGSGKRVCIRSELIQSKNFYHPFSVRGTLALPYAKSSHCYLDWISCQFLFFIWPSEPTYTHSTNWEVYGVRSRKLFLNPFQCTRMYVCFLLVFNGKLRFPQNLKILNEL